LKQESSPAKNIIGTLTLFDIQAHKSVFLMPFQWLNFT